MADVTISEFEYNRLVRRDEWLECLEAAGVDNWEGYGIAQDMQREDEEEE